MGCSGCRCVSWGSISCIQSGVSLRNHRAPMMIGWQLQNNAPCPYLSLQQPKARERGRNCLSAAGGRDTHTVHCSAIFPRVLQHCYRRPGGTPLSAALHTASGAVYQQQYRQFAAAISWSECFSAIKQKPCIVINDYKTSDWARWIEDVTISTSANKRKLCIQNSCIIKIQGFSQLAEQHSDFL